jgi:hypothetical protein
MKYALLFFVLFSSVNYSQTKSEFSQIDLKMSKMPDSIKKSTSSIAKYINNNFKTDSEKIRCVFYWTISNINYDIEKYNNILKDPKAYSTETSLERIENTLVTKKGVCQNYSEIFADIANQLNIKTYVIPGYTKQNGEVSKSSHAWCASKIDGKWFLFDPTWGSGYVKNNQFFKKVNNIYFKINPTTHISTHIPFDYLWQFLNYPITNQEFYDGKTQIDKSKSYFDFEKEIDIYEKFSEEEKAIKATERIEKNGLKNNLITNYLSEKKAIKNYESLTKINSDYNNAILLFNDFINYRNNQFKPKISDEELSKMIQTVKEKFTDCQDRIFNLGVIDSQNIQNVKNIKKSMLDVLKAVDEQEAFVKEYLSKGKLGRKSMFTKVTFFGLPIN